MWECCFVAFLLSHVGNLFLSCRHWAQTCHVTLSHLNSPTCGGTESLLPLLIQILSQPQPPQVLVSASRALTEAIIVPSDTLTPTRDEAVAAMVYAVSNGFVAVPLAASIDDDDVCHALSTMIGTLVMEEVDYVCSQPAEPLLHLLLQLQSHPSIPVTIPVLECWLNVQEVPTSARHDHWKAPLFQKVLEGLLIRISYPSSFTNWQDEVELDSQEFAELRRMVMDVLISCYFLLRVEFLRHMMSMQTQDWTRAESALYCLCCVSREVCARVKARAGGDSVRSDRDATAQQLLQLVQHWISFRNVHPLVARGIASFVGSYAPAWNVHCPPEAILQLLAYLRTNMGLEAAKATRSICVGCAGKLVEGNNQGALLSSVRESMDAVLSTDDEAAMVAVAEGSTRLLVQLKDTTLVRQSLGNIIISPVVQSADAAANTVAAQTAQSDAALSALTRYLHTLQVIVKFCDVSSENGDAHVLSDVVGTLWPFLDKMVQQCGQYEDVLNEVLSVHGQLLNTVPDLVAPNFSATVKLVVEAFERMKLPSTLDYIAGAVEAFSPFENDSKESFKKLLAHVTTVTVSYVTTEKRPDECPQVIRAFFGMNQRYMLFCPSALIGCRDFATIVTLAVECLTACRGERESMRATLNFLAQLFGWRSLRLHTSSTEALEAAAGTIDEQLLQHGEAVTRACIDGLSGGPQMLWPSLSDCLFAITTHVSGNNATGPVVEETTIAHQWVFTALSNCKVNNSQAVTPEMCQQIMSILFGLSREGQKSRPKAKMLLTDFAKICKGEMTTDALLTYSL